MDGAFILRLEKVNGTNTTGKKMFRGVRKETAKKNGQRCVPLFTTSAAPSALWAPTAAPTLAPLGIPVGSPRLSDSNPKSYKRSTTEVVRFEKQF